MIEFRHPSQTHGDPSPADGRKDLGEARTAHNRAVLPQEPGKAQPAISGAFWYVVCVGALIVIPFWIIAFWWVLA